MIFLFQLSQLWEYLVQPGNHFVRKLGLYVKVGAIDTFKDKLTPIQLEGFKNTCFGYFLDMHSFFFS